MTKKPRQKLNNLLRFRYFKAALVLLFVFAQIAGFFVGGNDATAQDLVCDMDTLHTGTDGNPTYFTYKVESDRTKVKWDEEFNVQFTLFFRTDSASQQLARACAGKRFDFIVYPYHNSTGNYSYYDPGISTSAQYFTGTSGTGFAARKKVTMKAMGAPEIPTDPNDPTKIISAYPVANDPRSRGLDLHGHVTEAYVSSFYSSPAVRVIYSLDIQQEQPRTLPALPTGVTPDTTTPTTGTGSTKDAQSITFKVMKSGEEGLRSKYRVLLQEKAPFDKMVFGANGLPKINVDWGTPESKLTINDQLKIPKKNYQLGFEPYYRYTWIGFNTFDTKIDPDGCTSGYLTESCKNVVFTEGNANGKVSTEQILLPVGFDPALYNSAWAKTEFANKTAEAGKPLGLVDFRVVPIIWANDATLINNPTGWYSYVYGSTPIKFTVEVYKTEADIKAACEADTAVTDKTICNDAQKMRYQVGSFVEGTTGTDQQSSGGLGETLLDFIRKVITHLLSLLTSLVYYVFSYIVAPFLVAILKIQAYKDDFVSVIYPGWLILRNISNIIFIIALLAIGLGTMFRVNGYQARSLVINLVLMALLINFSLVFAQGVVALADTVQAQFLPGDSQVINALAAKLMVEPLQLLRDSTGGQGFGASTALADISKAFVLLLFSVAALFAFVAVAAFLMVRLIALWVLYLLSPLAYASYVLPQTQKYFKQWWTEFIKYAFIGAGLAFFLNMAALLAGGEFFQRANFGEGDGFAAGAINFVLMSAQNLAVIGFMIVGMKLAAKSGVAGAKGITDFAANATKGTFKLANMGKQALSNKAFGGMSQKEGWKGLVGKAGLAVSNPIMAGKAGKEKGKAWLDKGRKKFEGNIAGIYGSNKPILGNSIKEEREKVKEFVSDDENYLKSQLANGIAKKDKVLTGAGMMKLADTGKFKDMAETLNDGMGLEGEDRFSNDAAGLNAATKEMVKRGLLDDGKRRDILNEFDKAAGKDKKNAHFGGNLKYDADKKDFVVRDLSDDAGQQGANAQFAGPDQEEWVAGQVKGRKNNLYEDLKTASNDATVKKNAAGQPEFTTTMAAVLAEQTVEALNNNKAATNFRVNNNDKFKVMKAAFEADNGTGLQEQMKLHYSKNLAKERGVEVNQLTQAERDAIDDKTTQRIDAIRNNLLNERTDGNDQDYQQQGGNQRTPRATVIVAPNGRPPREVVNEQNARMAQQQGRNVDLANPNTAIDNAVNQAPPNTQANNRTPQTPPAVNNPNLPNQQPPTQNTQTPPPTNQQPQPTRGRVEREDPQEVAERAREAEMNRAQAEREAQNNNPTDTTPQDNNTPPPTNNV